MTAWPPFNREGAQVRNVLGITLSRDAVFQVMSTVDRNNDGFIEYGEFVRSFGLSGLRKKWSCIRQTSHEQAFLCCSGVSSRGPQPGSGAEQLSKQVHEVIKSRQEHAFKVFSAFDRDGCVFWPSATVAAAPW
jgi:hypothetical protein